MPEAFGNQGAGAAVGALLTATGNFLIGNERNDTTASSPYAGLIGPDIYVFSDKQAGATVGLLTLQSRFDLMSYQRPT